MSWYLETGPDSDVVLSSRVRLARNVAGHAFTADLDPQAAADLFKRIRDAIFQANDRMPKQYRDLDLKALDDLTAGVLVEQRLISEDLKKACGSGANQPGRVVISTDEAVSVMIGEEDHIRIQAMAPGLDLQEAYQRAEEMAVLLEEKLPTAYDEQFGFLTACATNTGTGMRASAMVHLPGLTATRQMTSLQQQLERIGFSLRGAYGEHSRADGCLYQISNQVTLGLTEGDILSETEMIVDRVISLERQVRQELKEQGGLALEDRLWRQYGLLTTARRLTGQEGLNACSDLALGVEIGLFDFLDAKDIKGLLAALGPASVQQRAGRLLEAPERDIERATIIRALLKDKEKNTKECDEI